MNVTELIAGHLGNASPFWAVDQPAVNGRSQFPARFRSSADADTIIVTITTRDGTAREFRAVVAEVVA